MSTTAQPAELPGLQPLRGVSAGAAGIPEADTILLICASPSDAGTVEAALGSPDAPAFRLVSVTRLADATERLCREKFSVVMLDLGLPDAQGIDAFGQISLAAPDAAIVVLGNPVDPLLATQAVQLGADGCFLKGDLESTWWLRELRCIVECKAARNALRLSELRFHSLCEAYPAGVLAVGTDGVCTCSNAAYHEISGLSRQEVIGSGWTSRVHPDDGARLLEEWNAGAQKPIGFQTEFRLLRQDGAAVGLKLHAVPLVDRGAVCGHLLTMEEMSASRPDEANDENEFLPPATNATPEENELARVMLNSIGDAVIATDLTCSVNYMNRVAEKLTGWARLEAAGRPLGEVFRLIDGESRQVVEDPVEKALQGKLINGFAADCVLIHREGRETPIGASAAPIRSLDGRTVGVVLVFHDISDSQAMTQKMSHLAQHDFLTGLPNRVLLTDRLTQAIGLAHRQGKQIALMYVDLDFFKHINDSLGHAVGDQLLQSVAQRLSACVRQTDTVCRQGGDEFVILLAELEHPQDAAHVAEKLLASLAAPQLIGGHEIYITLSIGISVYPDDGQDGATIIQNADTAMYYAKEGGRNNYQFFRADMNTRAVQRMVVENSLRRALKDEEFVLHYQPEFDLASGAITGVEALLRWIDPKLGVIYPEQFVQIAEECGLIVPLGQWSLREACRQAQAWGEAGLLSVPLSVNISGTYFQHKDFLDDVVKTLEQTGLTANRLELEFTESTLMTNAERSAAVLKTLKAMGMRLAIDDFGTGYSSLNHLRRLPIDTLKIDQSFVQRIPVDSDDATIVAAVIGIGRNLSQRVVAEGVESAEQLAFLQAQHCDGAQGFHLSRPLPADEFARYLAERK
jgi:diguanylate cyclase (GGDEF)-like protein/PAS domain S-box-containing protein